MRCNWFTKAHNLIHRSSLPGYASSIYGIPGRTTITGIPRPGIIGSRHVSTSPGIPIARTPTPDVRNPLTAAQLSRASASAVRLCVAKDQLSNAYYILNSLRLPFFREKHPSLRRMPGLNCLIDLFEPLLYPRRVSPRLPAHALLHSLVRIGAGIKAAELSSILLQNNIRVRERTLEAIFQILVIDKPTAEQMRLERSWIRDQQLETYWPLQSLPVLAREKNTRTAIQLLFNLRQYKYRRTESMYQKLIHACLLQGEIFVGSLLFILVVKDWQSRKSIALHLNTPPDEGNDTAHSRHPDLDLDFELNCTPFPSSATLSAILHPIDETLAHEGDSEEFDWQLQASLQALANLASILKDRSIPFPNIAPLIRTIYRCPRVPNDVWVIIDKKPKRVKAYQYLHDILERLIYTLPSHPPVPIIKKPQTCKLPIPLKMYREMLPPLDLHAYHSLLHYALRHRLSPILGNCVLEHMTEHRKPPLEPRTTTYNILIRAGTVLHQNDVTDVALRALGVLQGRVDPEAEPPPPPKGLPLYKSAPSNINQHYKGTLMELSKVPIQIPRSISHPRPMRASPSLTTTSDSLTPTPTPTISPDSYTLSAYITHITATSQHSAILTTLFQILPELAATDHSSWVSLTASQRLSIRTKNRKESLHRAVSLGPHFFTVVLNALAKMGKTGTAERVWSLAKAAERKSWLAADESGDENENGSASGSGDETKQIKGWCLPIHAYTSMLELYAAEARRGMKLHHSPGDDPHWEPQTTTYVRGWGNLIHERRTQRAERNGESAKRMGLVILKNIESGGRDIYESLMRIQARRRRERERSSAAGTGRKEATEELPPDLPLLSSQMPKPDVRFFNAALNLFGRTSRRSQHHHRPKIRRRLRTATAFYARTGHQPRVWTPALQTVAEEMVELGFPVPLGFRYIFAGTWRKGTVGFTPRRQLDRRPVAFPRANADKQYRSYTIPVEKTKGLPLKRDRSRRQVLPHLELEMQGLLDVDRNLDSESSSRTNSNNGNVK